MSKQHLQALAPLSFLCLQIAEERDKLNWPSLNFLSWEYHLYSYLMLSCFYVREAIFVLGLSGFVENVWKLQGFVSKQNFRVFMGETAN